MPDAIKRSDERSFALAVREETEGKRKIFHTVRYAVLKALLTKKHPLKNSVINPKNITRFIQFFNHF